jgi:hypothetical protein
VIVNTAIINAAPIRANLTLLLQGKCFAENRKQCEGKKSSDRHCRTNLQFCSNYAIERMMVVFVLGEKS